MISRYHVETPLYSNLDFHEIVLFRTLGVMEPPEGEATLDTNAVRRPFRPRSPSCINIISNTTMLIPSKREV